MADIRCPLSIYLRRAERASPALETAPCQKGCSIWNCGAHQSDICACSASYCCNATDLTVRSVPATQFPAAQQSQLAVNLKVLQRPARQREKQSKEQRSILLNCRFAAGSRCAKKEEALAHCIDLLAGHFPANSPPLFKPMYSFFEYCNPLFLRPSPAQHTRTSH